MTHSSDTDYARFRKGIANAILGTLLVVAIIAAYLANQ